MAGSVSGPLAMLASLALLALLVPAAQADVRTSISGIPTGPITAGEPIEILVEGQVDCRSALGAADPGATEVRFTVTVEATPELVLSGPSEVSVPLQGCSAAQDLVFQVTYTATIPLEAPGLTPFEASVTVALEDGGVMATASQTDSFQLVAWPTFSIAVQAEAPVVRLDGKDQTVSFVLLNLGNTPIKVAVAQISASDGLSAEAAETEAIAGVPGSATDALQVPVQLREPDGRWSKGSVTLRFTPEYAYNPDVRGEPVDVTVQVENADAVERLAPAPPMVAPLALALLALLARRRA